MMRLLSCLALMLGAAGCHQRQATGTSCAPVATAVVRADGVSLLGGRHEISFVTTSGPRSGQTAAGRLVLERQADSLLGGPWSPAEQRVFGQLEMSPEDVGAIRMGEPVSSDPRQPGVAVYVSPAQGDNMTVVARIGTLSNSRGQQPYDAGYFTLYVREVTANGIRGGWASGNGREEVAAGHFCTRRQPA